MSFLVLDIGNTRLKWGLYERPEPQAALLAHGAVFLERIDDLAETHWKGLPAPQQMLGCVVAGDVVKWRVQEQLEFWDLEPRWVVPSSQAGGIVNGYEHPNRLGADRFVALIGARHRVMQTSPPKAALVVCVGTAVTIDALDESGRFLGGLILPGFGLMQKALEMGTSGLKVPTGDVVDFPTNTSDALMTGGAQAIAGAVERMYGKLAAQSTEVPVLFMTGGAASKLAPATDLPLKIIDWLIFEGLLQLQFIDNA
jgi:type III pantothenate kinase